MLPILLVIGGGVLFLVAFVLVTSGVVLLRSNEQAQLASDNYKLTEARQEIKSLKEDRDRQTIKAKKDQSDALGVEAKKTSAAMRIVVLLKDQRTFERYADNAIQTSRSILQLYKDGKAENLTRVGGPDSALQRQTAPLQEIIKKDFGVDVNLTPKYGEQEFNSYAAALEQTLGEYHSKFDGEIGVQQKIVDGKS